MKRLLVVATLLTTLLSAIAPAFSLQADYMDRDASGNAAYESMVIQPEALFDPDAGTAGKTYIAYQGFGLEPYVSAYDHASETWEGPFKIGDNPLVQDFHGGPSLAVDAQGRVHAFFGAHGSGILHAVSESAHDVSAWENRGAVKCTDGVTPAGTYPQPLLVDGEIRLFFRVRDTNQAGGIDDGAWAYVASATGAVRSWSPRRIVIGVRDPDLEDWPNHNSVDSWYADFNAGPDGTVHCTFHWRDISSTDMFTRWDLYYMRLDPGETEWETAGGGALAAIDEYADDPPYAECKIWESGEAAVNQMVVRGDDGGVPSILFLSETTATPEPEDCTWRYMAGSRLGDEVTFTAPAAIAGTDDFFDAGELDLSGAQPVAYLTTGGVPDPQALPTELHPGRGGDITRWVRDAGGAWTLERTVKASTSAAERYNDPQLVQAAGTATAPHPDARLMFSEWDNDGANFIHKVYLWGAGGFLGREFTPDVERLAGPTRVETAVEVSERAFPNGSDTVLIASKMDFPDVLCGAPLAHSYRAPLLLSSSGTLDAGVRDEVYRLFTRVSPESGDVVSGRRLAKNRKVVILGGTAAVSKGVEDALESALGSGDQVSRIAGGDRYETAAKVAATLKARWGGAAPERVVIASGETFPDALVVSPLASRQAWPILLTKRDGLPGPTIDAIRSLDPPASLIVGGEAAVSAHVTAQAQALGAPSIRLGGPTRYDTALAIARYAQGKVPGSEPVLAEERFVLASGEDFPDGLAGGVLAARFRATMLLTSRDLKASTGTLPGPTESWAVSNRDGVLDVYVLGGAPAISAAVETRLMSVLLAHE